MNNKIIQSFWLGDLFSTMEQLCIKSFLANGHEFHLYCYDEILNVPKGTILKDANEIVKKTEVFYDSRNIIASFSDYFRMKLLFLKGGWWVDMDIICMNHFDIQNDYVFSSEYVNGEIFPNIGCIKCPIGSEFMRDYIELMDERLTESAIISWGAFGPYLMKELLNVYESEKFIHPPEDFIVPPLMNSGPEKFLNFNCVINETSDEEFNSCLDSYSLHLFNELWRIERLDKNEIYHNNSLFERLKRKYR